MTTKKRGKAMLSVEYKRGTRLPIITKTKSNFIAGLTDRLFASFMVGDWCLWISPIFGDSIQILFDIDYHDTQQGWSIKNYNILDRLRVKLNRYGFGTFVLEKTPNGYHLVSDILFPYKTKFKTLGDYREAAKRILKNTPIDVTTSIRPLPIKRIGRDEKGNSYYPISSRLLLNLRFKKEMPARIYNKDTWKSYIEEKLLPKESNTIGWPSVEIILKTVKGAYN